MSLYCRSCDDCHELDETSAGISRIYKRPLEILNRADPRFTLQVELAVRLVKFFLSMKLTLLIQCYILYYVIVYHQGPRFVVQVGDKTVDFGKIFASLYQQEIEPYIPRTSAVTEVNFTVTRSGFEGQLLGVTIGMSNLNWKQEQTVGRRKLQGGVGT